MTYIILAASPVLLLIVVDVRKRDRGDLAAPDRKTEPTQK
jgi:hypothetical protein